LVGGSAKEKETKHSHLFPFIFKKNADLHVARRLTCYLLLLDHFVLISVAPKMRPNNLTPLVSIDDSHHNLFVSSDFSDSKSFPIFFFKTISSSFDTLLHQFPVPNDPSFGNSSEEKVTFRRSLLIHFDSIIGQACRPVRASDEADD
jgi:hypothetical protein